MREIADRIRGAHGFAHKGYDSDYFDQFENIDLKWMENMIFLKKISDPNKLHPFPK
jgi:hypothetical protein